MKMRALLLAASLAALAATSACKKVDETAPAAVASDGSAWGDYMEKFLNGYFPLNPAFAIYQGKHEFDGQLGDFSPKV